MADMDPEFTALPLQALADAALQRGADLGATHVDVRIVRLRTGQHVLRDAELERSIDAVSVGIAVRVVHDGTWGFAAGVDLICPLGGDGTVRFVAEELAGTDAALALIPLGTGNLLARNLRLPIDNLEACINTAIHGARRDIDTSDLKVETTDGTTRRHTFLVIAGAGLDAEVMGDTRDDLKVKAGWLAYGEAGMRHLPGHRKEISISIDGGAPQRRKVRSVMIANCGELTAGMDFVPEARFDDGLLDVVMLSPRHVGDWIRIAAKTLTKSRGTIPVMETHQATRCRVILHEPMIAQLDGDAIGELRSFDARVRPETLRIQVPASDVPDSAAAPAMKPESVPEQHA